MYGFHEVFGKTGGHEGVEGAAVAGLDVRGCAFCEGGERLGLYGRDREPTDVVVGVKRCWPGWAIVEEEENCSGKETTVYG